MADKRGLQIIGFIFGAITATVVSIAAVGIVNAGDSTSAPISAITSLDGTR
jgi:hypothetical protein